VNVYEFADAIAALSLDEARALVAALRARLALDAPSEPDWRHMVVLYGHPPGSRERDEAYAPHALALRAVGPNRVQVMSQLRVALSLTLGEARAAVDGAPCELGVFPDRATARKVADALAAAGAAADVYLAP